MTHLSKRLFSALLCFLFLLSLLPGAFASTVKRDSLGQAYDLSTDYLVTQYADATGQHGCFYTIENESSFLIFDGGWAGNADAVRDVIAAHGNHVSAWIISHPHQDHAGAFNVIMADPGEIVVDEIYDNGFDYDFIEASGEPYDDLAIMETFHALTQDVPYVTHLKRGDSLTVCGLTFDVYNAYDDVVLANVGGEKDYQNNASLLLRIRNQEDSILFCSDIKYDMNAFLSANLTPEMLSSTYVQLGHHGNWSLDEDFYARTGAGVFFLDAPSNISDNPDFPASTLKADLLAQNKTVLDYSTAPHSVVLK